MCVCVAYTAECVAPGAGSSELGRIRVKRDCLRGKDYSLWLVAVAKAEQRKFKAVTAATTG